jgi:hypothetical protein
MIVLSETVGELRGGLRSLPRNGGSANVLQRDPKLPAPSKVSPGNVGAERMAAQ